MAHFNECANLIAGVDKAEEAYFNALIHEDKDPLQVMLREQKDCIDDEFRELLTSLGEMSKGEKDASAVWKKWKARYPEAQAKPISEMSPEDQLEIKFELIDIMHFVFNMAIGLNMSAEEMFKLYYLKNKHNFERQDNGY
ncbi:hypothetical protein KNU35_gp144 [Escherichia phage vB_EcoM_005]|uniref:dCTP pyrophosphatase n=1 Tax=Escherichia phage vB_EcoM_005 TaxID=2500761 RepID=A0A3Q9R995_9CAUD|nr:hypothetical protein KNU35_gp144 [Escherichia phage vB_EcoM_005]AZV01087.1 hypothetical protein vBEcoM005_200 [Escherichia phage vB_EcoM_005]